MCCEKIGKILLIAINIGFFLGGGALLAIGIIAFVKEDLLYTITDILTGQLAEVFSQLESLASIDLAGLIKTNAIILLVIGGVLFVLGFLGMCGACKMSKTLLNIYGTIVLVLLMAQVGLGVYAYMYSEKFEAQLQDGIRFAIYKTYEKGYRFNNTDKYVTVSPEAPELAVDILQVELQCCGVSNYSEWITDAKDWDRNYTTDSGDSYLGEKAVVPPSCCKLKEGEGVGSEFVKKEAKYTVIRQIDFVDLIPCMKGDASTRHDTGCYDRLYEIIKQNETIIISVMVIIILVQVVGVACACFLKDNADK